MQAVFGVAEHGSTPDARFPSIVDWPWTWLRVMAYVRRVRNVYERVAMDPEPETALPARWMFWDEKALDKWFEERRESLRDRSKD